MHGNYTEAETGSSDRIVGGFLLVIEGFLFFSFFAFFFSFFYFLMLNSSPILLTHSSPHAMVCGYALGVSYTKSTNQ